MLQANKSWIDLADEQIPIADVLSAIGTHVPSGNSNRKIHCPFGFYHSDGGMSKAMRLYRNSNTVYCFSCSKRYSPVSLAAAKWDCSWNNAALRLLDDFGYKPKSLDERWQDAISTKTDAPDLLALGDALKMYCSGISGSWASRQLDDSIASKLNECLSLLDCVRTDEDADKWLATCKQVMRRILETP